MKAIVKECGLLPLMNCLLTMFDARILTTFIERWYKDTYSFHLPFGEMSIILDDVSCLFHIPLAGSFFSTPIISQDIAHMNDVHHLGVTEEQVVDKFRYIKSAHFHLVHQGMCEEVVRVYMLHLLGCTILADKYHVYIDVKYMWLFTRLEHCSWAWGVLH